MKLSVSHHFVNVKSTRGLQKFGAMLLEELLSNFDISLVKENAKSDIHLMAISGRIKPGSKNIVRLDGVYYDAGRMNMNVPIRATIKKSDGVIFQSEWCKTFVSRMLSVSPDKTAVIYNGTKQSVLKDIEPYSHQYDKVFICCANWRVNKRLKSIIQAFEETKKSNPNIGLFVVGKPDHNHEYHGVEYFGHVIGEQLWTLYKASDYMCHICHIDACPNSVVEGLSAGLPVLCNNIGGTPEIVNDDGIIVNLDDEFNFLPIKKMKDVGHKMVNLNMLTKGMSDMLNRNWDVSRPDLDISVSAKKYYEFFESVLR